MIVLREAKDFNFSIVALTKVVLVYGWMITQICPNLDSSRTIADVIFYIPSDLRTLMKWLTCFLGRGLLPVLWTAILAASLE